MNVSRVSFVVLLLVSTGLYASSRQQLVDRAYQEIPFTQRDTFSYPSPALFQALTLNYETFAASLAWISGLLYFGEWKMSKSPTPPEHLLEHARLARSLDHEFLTIYEWINATYLHSHHLEDRPTTYKDLENLRLFNEQGLARHPDFWKLHYITGMNYIGYSYKREPEERLEEIEHAIHYLKRCTRFSSCPDTVPTTIAYLYMLKNNLESDQELPSGQRDVELLEFYKNLYAQSFDPARREALETRLLEMGMTRTQLADLGRAQVDQFQLEYERRQSYLPLDLWTQVVYPTADSQALLPDTQETHGDR